MKVKNQFLGIFTALFLVSCAESSFTSKKTRTPKSQESENLEKKIPESAAVEPDISVPVEASSAKPELSDINQNEEKETVNYKKLIKAPVTQAQEIVMPKTQTNNITPPKIVPIIPEDPIKKAKDAKWIAHENNLLALVLDYHQVMLADASDPKQPKHLATIETKGQHNGDGDIVDGYFYLPSSLGLTIYDISNAKTPKKVAHFNLPSAAVARVERDIAYVGTQTGDGAKNTLSILDVSNKSNPKLLGKAEVSDRVWGLHVENEIAYVSNRSKGLRIIDASTPSNPIEIGSYLLGVSSAAFSKDNYLYAVKYDRKNGALLTLDLNDPTNPELVSTLPLPNLATGMYIKNKTAYITLAESGIFIADVSVPSSPSKLYSGKINPNQYWSTDVTVIGEYAFFTDLVRGLYVSDVKNPGKPILVY